MIAYVPAIIVLSLAAGLLAANSYGRKICSSQLSYPPAPLGGAIALTSTTRPKVYRTLYLLRRGIQHSFLLLSINPKDQEPGPEPKHQRQDDQHWV